MANCSIRIKRLALDPLKCFFAKIIMDAGFASPIRKPRGQDIFAACGQLKSETTKIRKSQVNKLVPVHAL